MRSKNRLLASVLCLLMVVFCAIGLASCDSEKECSHRWGEWSAKTNATCTEAGVQKRVCTDCGISETTAIAALGHDWNEATCSTPKTCSRCSVTEGGAKAHSYTQETVKDEALKSAATCTSAAVYYKSCACGAISETETFTYGDPVAHSYIVEDVKDDAIKSIADCMSPAVYYKSCECGAVSDNDTEIFTVGTTTEHSYTVESVKGEALKSAATCTSAAVYYKSCVCGKVSENDSEIFTVGSELGHSYKKDSSTPATCESPATETYVCSKCDDSYVENVGDALTHDISGVKATERNLEGCEYVLVYVCKREVCGKEVEGDKISKHTYVATVTKDATCKENGEKTLVCSCGDTKTEPIAKDSTGHAWSKGAAGTDGKRTDTCSGCGETRVVTVSNTNTSAATNANNLKDTEIELKVDADTNANIKLDDGVINSIGNKDITVSADKLSDADKANLNIDEDKLAQVGNNPIFNFTINDGTENISQFGADNYVTITLPYTPEEGEDVDSIAVWFINEDGELESIKATYNNGYVTFKTNHFSYYTVTRLTPEERCALYGCSFVEYVENGSCTTDAYVLKVCVRCHKTEKTITAEAKGHNYNGETEAATCTKNGFVVYTCVGCGHSYRIRLNATGHSWSVEDSAGSTCAANGYTKYGCDNCDAEYTEIYDKLPHEYIVTVVNATCETNGYTLNDCKNCDHGYTEAYVPAFGHNYETPTWAWTEDHSSATLTFTCANDKAHEIVIDADINVTTENSPCSDYVKSTYTATASYEGIAYTDEKTVESGTPGHKFSTEWKSDKNEHWHECVCGEKADVSDHIFENETVTKEPTCSKDGESIAYCVCGESHVSVVPATKDHKFSAEWKSDKNEHWHECACGEKGDVSRHSFKNETVTKEPTCSETGESISYCECGESHVSVVPATREHNYRNGVCTDCGAKSGDNYYLNLVNSWKDIDGFVIKIRDFSYEVKEKDSTLLDKLKLIGSIKQVDIAELALYINDGEISGAAIGSIEIFNGPIADALAVYELRAVIEDGYIYIALDYGKNVADKSYNIKMSVEEALGEYFDDDIALVYDFIIDAVIPTIDDILAIDSQKTDDVLSDVFNMIFTFEMQEDGSYVANLDYDKLRILNDNLANKPIAEVVDIYFGEGTFDSLADFIYEILDLKISEIPEYLDEKGLNSESIIARINDFAAKSGAPYDFDINEVINDEEYADTTIGMLLFETEDDSYIDKFEENVIDPLREETLYEMAAGDDAANVKDGIDEIIDIICNNVTVSFTTDELGMLTSINVDVDNLTREYDDGSAYLNFRLELLVNETIDVTWSDIIGSIEEGIVLPPEDMLDDTFNVYFDIYSGYVTYKGEEYRYSYGYEVSATKALYDNMTGIMFYPNCNDWIEYNAIYATRNYRFTIASINVDGKTVTLLIDQYSDDVVELVVTETGFTAIFDDGTEKDIVFDMSNVSYEEIAKVYTDIYFAVFEDPEGRLESLGKDLTYFYNPKLQEYSEVSLHELVEEYEIHGTSCEDGGCTITTSCKNCDYYEKRTRYWCDYEYGVEIDLSQYGACGGTVSVDQCVICGNVSYIGNIDTNCKMYESDEKILDDNGNVVGYKYTSTCVNCGLTYVDQNWVEYDTLCTYKEYNGRYIYVGEKCIIAYEDEWYSENHQFEYTYELDGATCDEGYNVIRVCSVCGETHEYRDSGHRQEEREISLSELGLCGGYIYEYFCPICDVVQDSHINDWCNWEYVGDNEEGFSIYNCCDCGATKLEYYNNGEKDENCQYLHTEVSIYYLKDQEIYRYEYSYLEESHNYQYTYKLEGSTCNEGYYVTRYCPDCGQTNEYHGKGHREEYRELYFDQFGLCGGYVSERYCPVCETVMYSYIRDWDCDWYFVETNDEGYSVYECERCGATKLSASYDGEKDENCEYLHTEIRVYIIDGEEVYRYEHSSIDDAHNYEYSYEFEGEGCEDGYTVTVYCPDCGYSDEYYDNGHYGDRREISLNELGLCGGYIYENYCTICDTVLYSEVNDNCWWNHQGETEEGNEIYSCTECGATKVTYQTRGEKDQNCQYEGIYTTIYFVNGEEVYRYESTFYSQDHNYEFSYKLDGENCEDGYTITIYCPDCGYSDESYEWGHQPEFVGVEFDQFGLCGGYGEYNYCSICDEIVYSNIYDGDCDWEYLGDNDDGYGVYECYVCGATRLLGYVAGEKDENCIFEYIRTYVYIVNGEEVFRLGEKGTSENHIYECNYVMNGSSCTDGGIAITTCKDCDYYHEENFDYHMSDAFFDLNEVAGCCEEHYIYISGCPCGQDYYVGFDSNGFIYDEEKNIYVCENCDLTYEHNTRWVEEGCSKVEITYVSVKLAGEELYSNETEVTCSDHSYKNVDVSINDGVTTITSVCEKCGNEARTEMLSADVVFQDGEYYYDFIFTPKFDGKYTIKSLADSDTYVILYEIIDGEMVEINRDDDSGNNGQFLLTSTLTAGTTYVYRIGFYGYDEEGIISFAFGEVISENIVCWHDDRTYFTTLADGSESCEDGTLNGRICSLCGYVDRISVDYYHNIIDREIIYLEEHGACYGDYVYRSCACGEENDIYLNHCSDNWTYNQYEEDGKLVTVDTYTCSSCGLRYDRSYYSERDLENCTLTYYYEIVISIGGKLIVSTEYSEEHEEHDVEIFAELMNGVGSSCNDGVFVTEKCKYCDYENNYESYYHRSFDKQIIDLSQYGNVCGGYAILCGCVCGEDAYLDTNNILCEYDERWCEIWIDDVITDSQYTINGWYGYDYNSYIRTCAVTDPAERACGYKIRRATYWLQVEGECKAYQYQTWQFGYNEETDTWLYEITFKTGNSRTYHNYTVTNFDSATENGVRYDCQDCGSYYVEKNYYNSEGKHIKYERIVSNTTEDGNDRYQEYVSEYSFDENGDSYTSYEYERIIRADGEEYWCEVRRTRESYSGPFGENGYLEYYSYSNSDGENYSEEGAYVYYNGYRYCIFTMYTDGEYWDRHDYTYSFEGECMRTESYSNSDGESWSETSNYCRDYHYEIIKEPTCSQDGEERYQCNVCGTYKESYILKAHDHDWVYVTDNWYYCFTCGLENANGASGDIIMEDLTELYGNGENYVVGYWNRNNVEFTQYVCLILADGTEIIVEGVEFYTIEGLRAYAFSKSAVEAFAAAKEYTDYEVKFVFVPYGADSSFDYAVIFAETTNIGVVVDNVSFKDYIGEGETVDYVITPTEDGIWTFTSYAESDSYAYLYDAEGELLANDDDSGYNNNFEIIYDLKAGETYTLSVRWYSSDRAGYIPLVFTCEPIAVE